MGSSGKPQAPNFSVFDNFIQEPAYLSGSDRWRHDQVRTRSAWWRLPIPEVNRLMNAFMAGAKETNPKVEFTVKLHQQRFDPPKANEAALRHDRQSGADVMYAERWRQRRL